MLNQLSSNIQSALDRMHEECCLEAVIVLHEKGSALHRAGFLSEKKFSSFTLGATAWIQSASYLQQLEGTNPSAARMFLFESSNLEISFFPLENKLWLICAYPLPQIPGQFRIKLKKYAETITKLLAPLELAEEQESDILGGVNLPLEPFDKYWLSENITRNEIISSQKEESR